VRRRHARLSGAVAGHWRLHRRTEARQRRQHGDSQGSRGETTQGRKMRIHGRYFVRGIIPSQERKLFPSNEIYLRHRTAGLAMP
jgi:hypothetical protein